MGFNSAFKGLIALLFKKKKEVSSF